MSNTDQDWNNALERTHEAVRKFARSEFNAYALKIIYRMRRFPAVGIFGDHGHKTLWDEYCYERHTGPSDPQLVRAWAATLRPYYDEIATAIPDKIAVLLSIYSVWELEGSLEICGSIWPDGIRDMLEQALIHQATVNNDKRQL
jgi:hypothetical protein